MIFHILFTKICKGKEKYDNSLKPIVIRPLMEDGVFGNDTLRNSHCSKVMSAELSSLSTSICDVSMNNNSREGQKGTKRQIVNT